MRILITGCAGYLGTKVATLLKNKGRNEIFGIDINSPRNEWAYNHFVKGSVTDAAAMEFLFNEAKPDVAIHLAFVVNAMHDESKEEEIDIKGTENFLTQCERHQVKRIIFMSSAAAYGAHSNSKLPYTETSPINGNETYSYSRFKAITDRMVTLFMRSFPTEMIILRPCLFVGPNTDNSFFEILKFPFVPQIVDQSKIRDPEFQFIHEDDMANCLIACIEKENVCGIFNVAADGVIKLSDIAQIVKKRRVGLSPSILYFLTKILWKLRIIGSPPGQLEFMRYSWIIDNSKMKTDLYQPRYTSREAFLEFIKERSHKNH